MINDLDLAIAISERFKESEMTVSRGVFFQVLERLAERGDGRVLLNNRQSNSTYPFIHRVYWRGIIFIHFSRETIETQRYSDVQLIQKQNSVPR